MNLEDLSLFSPEAQVCLDLFMQLYPEWELRRLNVPCLTSGLSWARVGYVVMRHSASHSTIVLDWDQSTRTWEVADNFHDSGLNGVTVSLP